MYENFIYEIKKRYAILVSTERQVKKCTQLRKYIPSFQEENSP